MKTLLKSCYYTVAAGALAMPAIVSAQGVFDQAQNNVKAVGNSADVGKAADASLPEVVGRLINVLLGFIGILLLVYILYAGFLYMTAGGDSENVKKATTMIRNAIVGLLIIVAAFAISNFVLGSLINVAT